MMSTIPVAEATCIFKSNEDSKESILFTLQTAVKQIQYCSSLENPENGFSTDIREVCQLCEHLDKAFFHGLKCYERGYWSFVKEFTHGGTVNYLQGLQNVRAEIQCGRAWLCTALNENSLESYFRSFQQNLPAVRKYYNAPALLCDRQRMEVILMLMAGLEYIPFNVQIEMLNIGCGLSFFERSPNFEKANKNSFELVECPSYENISEVDNQNAKCDDAVLDCAVEAIRDVTPVHEIVRSEVKKSFSSVSNPLRNGDCHLNRDLCKTISQQDLERITHCINIDADYDSVPTGDLEVVRTRVVRRTKRSVCHKSNSDEKLQETQCEKNGLSNTGKSSEDSDHSSEHRLSKVTNDSGLCLETPCSSDSEVIDFNNDAEDSHQMSFEIGDFRPHINVTFSTPKKSQPTHYNEIDKQIEERGMPEGREDPVNNTCVMGNKDNRPSLHSGNEALTCLCHHLLDNSASNQEILTPEKFGSGNCEEEEISIYDVSNISQFLVDSQPPNEVNLSSSVSDTCKEQHSSSPKTEMTKVIDTVSEELEKIAVAKAQEGLDLRVGNNVLLYLLVEVFEYDDEVFYKMYYGYLNFTKGIYQKVYLLLTNKGVYLLKPGNNQQKFFKCGGLRYSSIDYILIYMNYQGFKFVARNKEHFSLHTADEDLTRSIISSLEVGIRRFIPKLPLPSIHFNTIAQNPCLLKFLSAQLNCDSSDVLLRHYALARWEDYTLSTVTPSGPMYQDYLMYRHKFAKENNATPWQPGFFLLKGGVLYCMEDEKSKPLFFIQMCAPHCKGCRRIHLLNRPHTFEVIRSNSDSLQLAAADTYEASKWLQCFLETVSLAGHFIDADKNVQKPSCIFIANDSIIVGIEECGSIKLLGKAHINDLVTVFTDSVADNFIMLEFEIAEASKSSGEWVIYFESTMEKEKFLDVLNHRWTEIFQIDLNVENIKDLYLRKKYRQVAVELKAEKVALRDFCVDN